MTTKYTISIMAALLWLVLGLSAQLILATFAMNVLEVCESKLSINKLSDFKLFIEEYKKMDRHQVMGLNSRCAKQEASILELEKIVSVTNNVCDNDHIDKMIDYHDKYLLKSHAITAHLFKLYAVQVSYTCKMNIKKNLLTAQSEMKQISKVLTEARNAIFNDLNLKTNLQMISSQTDEPVSSNIKPKTSEELLMDEFREILTRSARIEDVLAYKQQDCLKGNKSNKKSGKIIAKKQLNIFMKSALICHRLSRYYTGSILSLAKLANHGYMAKLDELDNELAQNRIFKDWLIAVQICEPLTHIRAMPKPNEPDTFIMDTCAESVPVVEPMIFEDSFDEIGDNIPALAKLSDSSKDVARAKWRAATTAIMRLKIRKHLAGKNNGGGAAKSKLQSILSLRQSLGDNIHTDDTDDDDEDYSDEDMAASYITRVDSSILNDDELASVQSMKAIQSLMPTYESLSDVEAFPDEKEVQFGFEPASYFTTLAILTAVMLAVEWIFLIALTLMARIESGMELSDVLKFPPKFPTLRPHTNFDRVLSDYDDLDEDELIRYDELTDSEKMHEKKLRKIFGRAPPSKFRL